MFVRATGITGKAKSVALLLAASLSLSACQGEGEGLGTLIGAGLGAFIGHEIGGSGDGAVIGTMMGTVIGASLGGSVGRKMDEADRLAAGQARYAALENYQTDESSYWYNPDSGNQGSYTPQPAYQTNEGQYCREYTQNITIGGETETGYGTACRQPDGSWKIING
jgi:surface antigen